MTNKQRNKQAASQKYGGVFVRRSDFSVSAEWSVVAIDCPCPSQRVVAGVKNLVPV